MIRRSFKVMLLAVIGASYLCACSSSRGIVSPVYDAPNYTVATLAYYNGQKDYQEQIKTMTDYIESAEKSDKKSHLVLTLIQAFSIANQDKVIKPSSIQKKKSASIQSQQSSLIFT